MIDKPDTPPAEPPVNETIFEKHDRVLHDMGNPQPKESKQWLREYAAKMLEAAPQEVSPETRTSDEILHDTDTFEVIENEAPQGAPETENHLHFANYGGQWTASTSFGSYFLIKNGEVWEVSQSFKSPHLLIRKDSRELAEAYAQKDFDTRIGQYTEAALAASDARIAELYASNNKNAAALHGAKELIAELEGALDSYREEPPSKPTHRGRGDAHSMVAE